MRSAGTRMSYTRVPGRASREILHCTIAPRASADLEVQQVLRETDRRQCLRAVHLRQRDPGSLTEYRG